MTAGRPCSAETRKTDTSEQIPIHVVSNKMIAERQVSMVEFIGDVRVTRQESVLLAESVKIFFYESEPKDGSKRESNIEKIVATGNVEYTEGERKAFSDKAVYTADDGRLVLTGKEPKLITGTNWVTGKKITFFRNQEKVIVESSGTTKVNARLDSTKDITDKDQ